MPTVYNKVVAGSTTIIDISSDTVAADKMLYGYTAHAASGAAIIGSIAAKTSTDLTASNLTVTAPAGHYASDATKTLTDANLIAGNIKKDVTIFGVTGTLESGGGTNTITIVSAVSSNISGCLSALSSAIGSTHIYWFAWVDDRSYVTGGGNKMDAAVRVGSDGNAGQWSGYRNDSNYGYYRRFAGTSTTTCNIPAGTVFKYILMPEG